MEKTMTKFTIDLCYEDDVDLLEKLANCSRHGIDVKVLRACRVGGLWWTEVELYGIRSQVEAALPGVDLDL